MDKEPLYPALQVTNRCNKQCAACLRSADATSDDLTFAGFLGYLDDLKTLSRRYRIRHQFVTGGEPTIWRDDGRDIKDLLIALASSELIDLITMPTNGKVFEDPIFARDFFAMLSNGIERPLVVGVSIATYQENLSDTGYIALDNLVRLSREPGLKLLPIILVTLAKDDDIDVRLKKIYPRVFQRVTPLAPLGNASDMRGLCPSLSLSGNNKKALGAYLPYFKHDVCSKCAVPESEFGNAPNAMLMDALSHHNHCGNSPFIDESWHYCLPFKDNPECDLGGLGGLPPDTLSDFMARAPFIARMRRAGIVTAVRRMKGYLNPQARDRLEELFAPSTTVPVAYRGCMLCKELHDRGVLRELNGQDTP